MNATSIQAITDTVCHTLGVTIEQLKDKTRLPEIVDARKIISLLHYHFNGKDPYTVSEFIGKDRASVYNYIKRGNYHMECEKTFRNKYNQCLNKLLSI